MKPTKPSEWAEGRLTKKIDAAKQGDQQEARMLLHMAALQLREHGQLEPDLVVYLSETLLSVAQSPAPTAPEALRLSGPKSRNPPHRPPKPDRQNSMVHWWQAACDMPELLQGDEDHIKSEAKRISKLIDEDERYAQLVDWQRDDYGEALLPRKSKSKSTFNLAASMFNEALKCAQEQGLRLEETPVKAGTIRSAVYRSKINSQKTHRSEN